MPSTSLTRQQLYDLVWSRAMIHVAKDVGLSGRGLAKLCERHEIPVPPLGYWAKKVHGHKVRQPPLEPPSRPALDRIEITPTPVLPSDDPDSRGRLRVASREPHRRATWPPTAPFREKTPTAMRQAQPQNGLLYPVGGVLNVLVSRAQVARALRI